MKTITLLLLSVAMVSSLSAQTLTKQDLKFGQKADKASLEMTKAITDTLGLYEFFSATQIYYSFGVTDSDDRLNNGSLSGTCYILDSVAGTVIGDPSTYLYQGRYFTEEIAMGYINPTGLSVHGIMFIPSLAAGPNGAPGTSTLTFNLYDMDGSVTSPYDQTVRDCAGTLKTTVDLPWAQIDTAGPTWGDIYNYVPFTAPVNCMMDFVVSIDLTDCYINGDTIYTYVGDDAALFGAGADYSWFTFGTVYPSYTGTWIVYDEFFSSGSDMATAIFAVVGPVSNGVETGFYQGVKMGNVYPNPAVAGTSTKVDFELEQAGEVNGFIFDMNGNKIQEINEGSLAAGAHTLTLNTNLPAGSYICSINTNGRNSSQIFIVK